MNLKKTIATLMLIATVLMLAAGCGSSGYKDGTYEGSYESAMQTVEVSVVIEEGQISQVSVTNEDELEGPGLEACAAIPGMIVEAQSTEIDALSGATVTSNAICEATNAALEKAE